MTLQKEIKLVGTGRVNTDISDVLLQTNDIRMVINGRVGISDKNYGSIRNVKGTLPFTHPGITMGADSKVVGQVANIRDNSIIYFVYDATNQASIIIEYFPLDNSFKTILWVSSVFTDYLAGAFLVGDLLYWNDGVTDLKKINIQKAKHYYQMDFENGYRSINKQTYSYAKYPPTLPPSCYYDTDTTVETNNIRGMLFQFKYTWVYDDHEESASSPISKIALPDQEVNWDGGVVGSIRNNNVINVYVNTGHETVKKIDLMVRSGNTGLWGKYITIDKAELGLDDNVEYKISFYNNRIIQIEDQVKINRICDKVPLAAKCWTYLHTNNIAISGLFEGYENIQPDVTLNYHVEPIATIIANEFLYEYPQTIEPLEVEQATPPDTYLVYWGHMFDMTHVPAAGGVIRVIYEDLENEITIVQDLPVTTQMASGVGPFRTAVRTFINNTLTQQLRAFTEWENSQNGGPQIEDTEMFVHHQIWWTNVNYNRYTITIKEYSGTPGTNGVRKGFKSGAHHPFGLVYFDQVGRPGFVNPVGEIYLPFFTNNDEILSSVIPSTQFRYLIDWQLNHTPPLWAHSYQFVYAKNRDISNFRQYIIDGIENNEEKTILDITPLNRHNAQSNAGFPTVLDHSFPNSSIEPYAFTKGDRVRFLTKTKEAFPDGSEGLGEVIDYLLDLEVVDAKTVVEQLIYGEQTLELEKSKLVLEFIDVASHPLIGKNTLVEIYTPRKEHDDLIYYEFGEAYPIINPGSANAYHVGQTLNQVLGDKAQAATGIFESGDVYHVPTIFSRNLATSIADKAPSVVEGMSASNFNELRSCDVGRPHMVNKNVEQKWNPTIRISGTYFEGTEINDLSYLTTDKDAFVSEQFGDVTAMVEIGYTLKVLQVAKNTSFYVGRSGLQTADGDSIQVNSTDAIGTKSPSFQPFGTQNRESVLVTERYAYFADVNNGVIVRDAANGMVVISEQGLNHEIVILCHTLRNADYYWVVSGYNPISKEVMFAFISKMKNEGAVHHGTYLWDEPENKWSGKNTYADAKGNGPEMFAFVGKHLVSFIKGGLWRHEVSTVYGHFYGVQSALKVKLLFNAQPMVYKLFRTLEYVGKGAWGSPEIGDITIRATYSDNGQTLQSRVRSGKFKRISSRHTTDLLKAYSTQKNLLTGHDLKGLVVEITLVNNDSDEAYLESVTIGYQPLQL